MKIRNYLPLAAYRIGAIGAAIQVGIALTQLIINSSAFSVIYMGCFIAYLGMLAFWLYQYRQAKQHLPVKAAKTASLPTARALIILSLVGAVFLIAIALWGAYQSYSIVDRRYLELRVGITLILTHINMLINALIGGAVMILTAQRTLTEAKAAVTEGQAVEQGREEAAPRRATWWTQDDTRQELRRK